MADIPASFFFNFFLFLLIPFLGGMALRRFNVPPIIGYILGGIVLGNVFSGIISEETVNHFALFGVMLLLFMIGLEINFTKLIALKKFIIIGGLLQIIGSIIAVGAISMVFHFSFIQSLLIGIAFASSSTALVAKIIQDRGEESSFIGELALGILMFQDLALIPFIIIFTYFNNQQTSPGEIIKNIALGVAEAAIILGLMYYFGQKLIPFVFKKVAETSRELLNLFIVIFIFFIAFFASQFGVPILIAIFIAGVLVSQTGEHHHIFSQIRPFRDLFAIIFFVYIGSQVVLSEVVFQLPSILLFSAVIIVAKFLILLIIFLYFRFSSRMAFSLAVFLFQVSENAFILLSLAFANGMFTSEQYLSIITTVLISLISTPLLINNKEGIYKSVRVFLQKYLPPLHVFIKQRVDFNPSPLDEIQIKNHVVICGYGRVGAHVGRAFMLANIPFIAIDYNIHTVEKAKKEGINIIYGDPTDIDILDYAQVDEAKALILALPEKYAQEAVILNAQKLKKEIVIISRVHQHEQGVHLRDLGVQAVVQPEIEASLSIIKKIFILNHMSQEEMIKKIKHFKVEQGI